MTTLSGTVHGKTIELDAEPGLPEGQAVTVTIECNDSIDEALRLANIPRAELWMDRLVFDSAVRPGERIVKGTNLAAEALAAELEQSRSNEEMLRAHPELTVEDLVALRHYLRVPFALRRSFGAWAEDGEELDQFIEETYRLRSASHREIQE